MAKVLGLSFFYHDSAAALVVNGSAVAAASEERFNRQKHSSAFPRNAIEYCLSAADFKSVNELDAIVFYEKPLLKLERLIETSIATWPHGLTSFTEDLAQHLGTKVNVRAIIRKSLPDYQGPIYFSKHHLSHAAMAFYSSGFKDAAILTMDGVGEWETATIGEANDEGIKIKKSLFFPHSLGLLYATLTQFLGFEVNDGEWKVMGLASYGQPKFMDQFRKLIFRRSDGSFALNMHYFQFHRSSSYMFNPKNWIDLFGFKPRQSEDALEQHHSDLAKSGQDFVEELIICLAKEARRSSVSENLVLSGGVALNGLANSKIEQEGIFKKVWIPSAPGDDGCALGAALLIDKEVFGSDIGDNISDPKLGNVLKSSEIIDFLSDRKIAFEEMEEDVLLDYVVELLKRDLVIGWVQGRMEFGPRALGARSILASPCNPNMKGILNSKIKYREAFRPFAPVVLLERAHEFFDIPADVEFPVMNKIVPVRDEARNKIPAVTHVDGTSRIQTVSAQSDPILYKLVKAFGEATGVPILVNTSFNLRGEPIVSDIKDVYNCFNLSGLDALVLGHIIVLEKKSLDDASFESKPVPRKTGWANDLFWNVIEIFKSIRLIASRVTWQFVYIFIIPVFWIISRWNSNLNINDNENSARDTFWIEDLDQGNEKYKFMS